jgi:hypothetical protein
VSKGRCRARGWRQLTLKEGASQRRRWVRPADGKRRERGRVYGFKRISSHARRRRRGGGAIRRGAASWSALHARRPTPSAVLTCRARCQAAAAPLGATHGITRVRSHLRRAWVHNGSPGVTVRRNDAGRHVAERLGAGALAPERGAALRRVGRCEFSFRDSIFKNPKLHKMPTKLEISKNKSCRGVINLQLSQRVSYVLINGFVGKMC